MKVPEQADKPGVASRHLCIVSRDRPLVGEFIASFTTALGAREEYEIVVDRRRGGPPAAPPSEDRRSHPDVTRALERDGFAVVARFETRPVQDEQLQLFEVRKASPVELLALEGADARQLKRILGFKRRRTAGLRRPWILTGLIGVLVALPVLLLGGKSLVSRTLSVEPPPLDGIGASALVEKSPQVAVARPPQPSLAVGETSSPTLEVRASQRAESAELWRGGASDSLRLSAPTPSSDAPTATAPSPSASSPRTPAVSRDSSPYAGPPQVDVTRAPAPASNGGEAYAVRLADSGGRPLDGAEVFLRIRTADGTLLDFALGAGANPGTYSITVPPLRSAPTDLRLRVVTNNTRVEIPLMP